MRIPRTVDVAATAQQVWQLLGPEFPGIASWARLVSSSSPTPDGRRCDVTGVPGTSHLVERLTAYDDDHRALAYVVVAGMPGFVREAGNAWSVAAAGPEASQVTRRRPSASLCGRCRWPPSCACSWHASSSARWPT